jgi:hypothetical protein
MTAIDTQGVHGPAAAKVTVQDAYDNGKLLDLDTVRERLAKSEPMAAVGFPVSDRIGFRIESGWNWDAETVDGDALVQAFLTIDNSEYQMSKDALLEATSLCGLPQAYVMKTPARLIQPHLNFWYKGGFDDTKEYKALVVGGTNCLAITRGTISPFSNLRLLDATLESVEEKYGKGTVYVDNKFEHSLRQTSLRLVIPEYLRVMEGTGTDNDTWSTGVQILNSLIGASQTSIDGYMFRYWCSNGAIDIAANSASKWSRRSGGQDENDVMEWARAAVDDVLGGLEATLDKVQAMTEMNIEGNAMAVLEEVFNTYRIPGQARQLVLANMVDEDNLTMYALMQAITAAANHPDVNPQHILGLLEAGGALPHQAADRCDSCQRFIKHSH